MIASSILINSLESYVIDITYDQPRQSLLKLIAALSKPAALVIDIHLLTLYPELSSLNIPIFTIPSGEIAKSREQKAILEDQLFEAGITREYLLIAVGGGVTLDLVGFIAATFCRGVPVIYIPTTLLAMVDVCIGGKNGLNTQFGKNTLGTFKTPARVSINLAWLLTLSEDDMVSGITESLKHALIADNSFFDWHRQHWQSILNREPSILLELIKRNLTIKASIVEQDEFETKGIRAVLNYGHTIGHALEAASDYRLSHGHAVALGILAENNLSEDMGLLSTNEGKRIGRTLAQLGCLHSLPQSCTTETVFQYLKQDKKRQNQSIYTILLKSIGDVHQTDNRYLTAVTDNRLLAAIDWLQGQSRNGFFEFITSVH